MYNNNLQLLILPLFLFVLGIIEIIFAKRIAGFYKRSAKYEWRPTAKPMPKSHYSVGLVRGIGIGMIVFSILIALIIVIG